MYLPLVDYSTFLRVQPPVPPTVRGGSREATLAKLARNVAVLFGVDVPGNPVGVTWVGNFNEVTLVEVSRGAMSPSRGSSAAKMALPDGFWLVGRGVVKGKGGHPGAAPAHLRAIDITEIPTATLHQFKPDTKAAVVLAGSNELFKRTESIFDQVLMTIGYLDDGSRFADSTRVAAWVSLVVETYRQQPALFVAALQARSVQRAVDVGWQPQISDELAADLASSEYEQGAQATTYNSLDSPTRPTKLHVLDATLRGAFPDPPLLLQTGTDDPTSNDYLLDALATQLTRYITQSADGGLAWIIDDGDGRRSVEVYLPQISILEALAGPLMTEDSLTVEPYGGGPVASFKNNKESHWRRILPRVPSLAEIRPFDQQVQAAIIATLVSLHDFFILRPNISRIAEEIIFEDRKRVADLTARVFGVESIWAVIARAQWAATVARRRPENEDAARANSDTMRDMARRYERGHIQPGAWVDLVVNTSPSLNSAWRRKWEQGELDEARVQRKELLGYWQSALAALGIDLENPLDEDGKPKRYLYKVTSLVHNYIGVWINDPENPDAALEHIEMGLRVLVPIRREVSQGRQNPAMYRKTIQILVRAIDRQLRLRTSPSPNQVRLLRICLELTGELVGLPELERFRSTGLRGTGDFSTAMSMLTGLVALAEHGKGNDFETITALSQMVSKWMELHATHPTFTVAEVRRLGERVSSLTTTA